MLCCLDSKVIVEGEPIQQRPFSDSLRLKNSRSGCLSRVTALYRAIGVLHEDAKHVREVSKKLLEIDEVFSRFEKAHYGYIAMLTGNLEELEMESLYFKENYQERMEFELKVKQWIDSVHLRAESREGSEIRPEDSVSTAGSRQSRSSSNLSIKRHKAKQGLARLD